MPAPDLEALEADITYAAANRDTSRLHIIGHGEISVVLGWPPENPTMVCKRLPPFPGIAEFRSYRDVVLRYIDALHQGGVDVVDTEVLHLLRRDRRVVGFHVQPLLPDSALGTQTLRRAKPSPDHPLLDAVVETVVHAVTDRIGIDAQLSNWMWLDNRPWQVDLTTPFLLDDRRRPSFDLAPFLTPLPAVARPFVGHQMARLVRRWTTPRGALVDLTANLLKEDLTGWLDPALRAVNAHVSPPVTEDEARRVHRADQRLWPLLFRLAQLNRWWQQHVRRRPYDFLLPEHTTYEPRERTKR